MLEALAYPPPGRAPVAALSVSIPRGHEPVTRRRVEPVWRVFVGGKGMGVKGTVGRTIVPGFAPVGRLDQGARLDRHEKATGGVGVWRDPTHVVRLGPRRETPLLRGGQLAHPPELPPGLTPALRPIHRPPHRPRANHPPDPQPPHHPRAD